jgi:hypothetical protein
VAIRRRAAAMIAATQRSFEVDYLAKSYSNVNWATLTAASGRFGGGSRATDTLAQNNEIVLALPVALMAGTWTVRLIYHQNTTNGIYTVAVSPDASAWTDLTSAIDGYAAAPASNVTADVTGLTVAAGMNFIRLKMATKNASATNYKGDYSHLSGVRTGA